MQSMLYPMRPYTYFVGELMTILYVPAFGIFVWFQWNTITDKEKTFPKSKFAVIAVCSSVVWFLLLFCYLVLNTAICVGELISFLT